MWKKRKKFIVKKFFHKEWGNRSSPKVFIKVIMRKEISNSVRFFIIQNTTVSLMIYNRCPVSR